MGSALRWATLLGASTAAAAVLLDTFRPEIPGASTTRSEKPTPLPPGLLNHGNGCYVNAVLQALGATTHPLRFLQELLTFETDASSCSFSFPDPAAVGLLKDLIKVLRPLAVLPNRIQTVDPKFLVSRLLTADAEDAKEQQDAHELLTAILQQLADVGLDTPSSFADARARPGRPTAPWSCTCASKIECDACHGQSEMIVSPSPIISLPIPVARARRLPGGQLPECSLEDCLRAFAAPQPIQRASCWRCAAMEALPRIQERMMHGLLTDEERNPAEAAADKEATRSFSLLQDYVAATAVGSASSFNTLATVPKALLPAPAFRSATRTQAIARLPELLVLHLERLTTVQLRGQQSMPIKIDNPVKFPLKLDLSSLGLLGSEFLPSPAAPEALDIEAGLLVHHEAIGAQSISRSALCHPPALYSLAAVVEHVSGPASNSSTAGGHYVTYRRAAHGWCVASDAYITSVPEERVLAAQAYLLVYERRHLAPAQPLSPSVVAGVHAKPRSVAEGVVARARGFSSLRLRAPVPDDRPDPGHAETDAQHHLEADGSG
jgi:ubiquitin C-terminal hydrolase